VSVELRSAIADLVPYQPGKPAEELARERGLAHVIKLASNEGPWGPVPQAVAAIEAGISGLNRYPDGGCVLLREALAARHGVSIDEVVVGHGADAIINNLSIALLEPGDEVVFGWPSFPSYLLDARMVGATPVPVPLNAEHEYDLPAMRAAVTERTKLVYVCNPNNPTGTMVGRDELLAFLRDLPAHVLPVLDEAYAEYVDDGDYLDGIVEAFQGLDREVVVLRTFSKIYGLAGLRVGYGVLPARIRAEVDKVRNAFDVTSLAQAAAIASLDAKGEITRRAQANRDGRALLVEAVRDVGLTAVPSVANFVCVLLDRSGAELYESLLDEGIIVRPLTPFGMEQAVRNTVGTPEETARCASALREVIATSPA
jgi:histidinol-phosphate aminotransferase